MIRRATEADIPRIVELGSRSMVDGPYAGKFKNNPEHSAKFASYIVGGAGLVLLWEEDGHVGGLIGFLVLPHYFNGEVVASEMMWYVEPEHRAGGAAMHLMWEAQKEAKRMGATRMAFAAPNEEVGRIYRRFGYKPLETVYEKEL